MQSRTLREGSVGLLILLGLGILGLMLVWLRGFNPRARTYQATFVFPDVGGMQAGAPVRYRGVGVGQVTEIRPATGGVEVDVEFASASLSIPEDALVLVNQSGLIGETSIDITPLEQSTLPTSSTTNPLAPDCASAGIICDGDRIAGDVGVSFGELIEATIKLSELFGDEQFFGEIRRLTTNSADAAASISTLSREVTRLTGSVERELSALSRSATVTTQSVGRTADQLGVTAAQVNGLLNENRLALSSTLQNINVTTNQIRLLTDQLSPTVESGEFVRNLELLSTNAAQASTTLRDVSLALGSQENVVMLQQTLESARATFQNFQKISADLDELTGDPSFRRNVRELIDGLSNLVSYTDELQQQTQTARLLNRAHYALNQPPAQPTAARPVLPSPAQPIGSDPAIAPTPAQPIGTEPTPIVDPASSSPPAPAF